MGGLNKDKWKSIPITKQMVWTGYERVKSNRGGAGIDQMDLEELDSERSNHLYKLWNRLTSGSYFPPAVKRVEIKKAGGTGTRPLGIPTVLDRIAQSTLKAYCEPRLESIFSVSSYGYRPGRGAHDALSAARINCRRYDWVIDMDIQGFFDAIKHDLLLRAVKKHFHENWVVMYISRWLEAGVMHQDGTMVQSKRGTPQGGVISPLLANLFLHYAFDIWMKGKHIGTNFERYADDIIVHCRTEQEAVNLLEQIRMRLNDCGLTLHPEKTRVVYCKDSNRRLKTSRPKKFTFLSYDFKPRKNRNRKTLKVFTGFDLGISHKSKMRIRNVVRQTLSRLRSNCEIYDIAGLLNAKIRGWIQYYAKLNRNTIRGLLVWINCKLMNWIMRKYKRFDRSSRKATRWLRGLYRVFPNLFAHWKFGVTP